MDKYTKTTYVNDSSPYLSAETLNHSEDGIEAVTDGLIDLQAVVDTKASTADLDTKADKSELETKADKSALDAKADKTEIPTTLPTPNAFKMTVNGATYTFDGSSEVVITLEDASGKEF